MYGLDSYAPVGFEVLARELPEVMGDTSVRQVRAHDLNILVPMGDGAPLLFFFFITLEPRDE